MHFKRILITGANGFIGHVLTSRLSRIAEYDVLACSHNQSKMSPRSSCGYVTLDVLNIDEMRRVFNDFAPDVVVNCAAMSQVEQCERDKEACWKLNVDAVKNLASQSKLTGARLVQLSTDFVYDGMAGPYDERARPNPINFYGRSKLAAENAVRDAGLDAWTIVRTVLVYGPQYRLHKINFVTWVTQELAKGKSIRVTTDHFRTPTFVDDLAGGIEKLIRFRKTGTYHLSGSEYLSVFDFAKIIAEESGLNDDLVLPVESAQLNQFPPRPQKSGFIVLKAATELGYKTRTIRQALKLIADGSTVATT